MARVTGVAALAAYLLGPVQAEAQTAAGSGARPKSSTSRTTPMHPHQLTLWPHGKPQRRHPAYGSNRRPFNQPTPVHNTFMAPGY